MLSPHGKLFGNIEFPLQDEMNECDNDCPVDLHDCVLIISSIHVGIYTYRYIGRIQNVRHMWSYEPLNKPCYKYEYAK